MDVVVVRPKASGGDVGDRMQVQASMQTTVKEFTADLLAHLKAREPEDNYESYALFEVLPVGERVVDDYEKVVPRLNVGMPDPMGALVFKLDDARMVALPLAPVQAARSGWRRQRRMALQATRRASARAWRCGPYHPRRRPPKIPPRSLKSWPKGRLRR